MFQRTIFTFKKIDPSKKFSQFTYYDYKFEEVNAGDCQKGMILKINGDYFLYSGDKDFTTSNKETVSTIVFKVGSKIVFQVRA